MTTAPAQSRFIVAYGIDGLAEPRLHPYFSKGLAFALARRKLDIAADNVVRVTKQLNTGEGWHPVDVWTFTSGGLIDHTRI